MTISLQPYTSADAERTSAFLGEAARVDDTLRACPLPEWHAFVGSSFNQGGQDFVLALHQDRVVALLFSARTTEEGRELRNVRIIVHPAHRRRGLGARLADVVDGQDRAGEVTIQASCPGSWAGGRHLLESRGFAAVRSELEMHLTQVTWSRQPAPPQQEVQLRPYTDGEADKRAWSELHDDGYAGGPNYYEFTPKDLERLPAEPGFGLWFAERRGAPVGFCHVKEFSGQPTINSLVTVTKSRGRGIGRSLLVHALAQLAERGAWPVQLWVRAENTPAHRLYESLGFKIAETTTTWWKSP